MISERIVPEQVVDTGKVWKGLGHLFNVRVKIAGEYGYTTVTLKKGESLADKVRATRRAFRRSA